MKKLIFVLLAFFLSVSGISAQAAGSEPMPKNSFAANPTMLVVCTKAPYPGGFSCSPADSLNKTWTNATLDPYLTQTLGCEATGTTVYSCRKNGLDGMLMYWVFASTNDVSTVLYIPWQTY